MKDPIFLRTETIRASFFKDHSKGFHEFKVSSSTSTPKLGSGLVYWYVISSGTRPTLFKFLKLKWLWDELTSQEFKLLLALPEFFNDEEFLACVRTLASGIPKKVIRTRLNNIRKLQGNKPWSLERYRSMKSLKYGFGEVILGTLPAKKFSGWTRHHKDHGSLRGSLIETARMDFTSSEKIDLFIAISVGKVRILGKELSLSPDDDSKESKRKWTIKSKKS